MDKPVVIKNFKGRVEEITLYNLGQYFEAYGPDAFACEAMVGAPISRARQTVATVEQGQLLPLLGLAQVPVRIVNGEAAALVSANNRGRI